MSSQAASREDGRRLSLRTLTIASVASATAAVVTSLFWKGGTPIAAAVTPVIVAVVSEMLHRPAEKIATPVRRRETERAARRARDSLAGARRPRGAAARPSRSAGGAHRRRRRPTRPRQSRR